MRSGAGRKISGETFFDEVERRFLVEHAQVQDVVGDQERWLGSAACFGQLAGRAGRRRKSVKTDTKLSATPLQRDNGKAPVS